MVRSRRAASTGEAGAERVDVATDDVRDQTASESARDRGDASRALITAQAPIGLAEAAQQLGLPDDAIVDTYRDDEPLAFAPRLTGRWPELLRRASRTTANRDLACHRNRSAAAEASQSRTSSRSVLDSRQLYALYLQPARPFPVLARAMRVSAKTAARCPKDCPSRPVHNGLYAYRTRFCGRIATMAPASHRAVARALED
jgi:3-deoxy-manno-octulosonate cytidylyltransferase (CMP-KDO synthetase)